MTLKITGLMPQSPLIQAALTLKTPASTGFAPLAFTRDPRDITQETSQPLNRTVLTTTSKYFTTQMGDSILIDQKELDSTSAKRTKPYQLGNFIDPKIEINSFEDVRSYFENIKERLKNPDAIKTTLELETALKDFNDLISVLKMNRFLDAFKSDGNTNDETLLKRKILMLQIDLEANVIRNDIETLFVQHPLFNNLPDQFYSVIKKRWQMKLDFFSEANKPLFEKLEALKTKYDQLRGNLKIEFQGEKLIIPKAEGYLKSEDQAVRQEIFTKIKEAYAAVSDQMAVVFDEMVEIRHQIAKNAGVDTFIDFMFAGGYTEYYMDYSAQDAVKMHAAFKKHIPSIIKEIKERRRKALGLEVEKFKPWDSTGTPVGQTPLRPFKSPEELVRVSIDVLKGIRPEFADILGEMRDEGHLDIEAREGKLGGGYMEDIPVKQLPVILMNATNPGEHSHVETLVHESGHSSDFYLKSHLPFLFREVFTMELAEVFSMGMELVSMDQWDKFYKNPKDLIRAQIEQLEGTMSTMQWAPVVDAFQQWIYSNPKHTAKERDDKFIELAAEFGFQDPVIWQGLEKYKHLRWYQQLHIFKHPFYYLQYAIAQMGALQIYRNYLEDPQKAIDLFVKGMRQGGTKNTADTYATMGIKFDFSEETIGELVQFVRLELEKRYKALEAL